jgi:hypothetical protein
LILLEHLFQGCTVVATVQGPSPEEAVFRDGVGAAATVEAAEQAMSPEEASFRGREDGAAELNKQGSLKGLVSGMELAMPRQWRLLYKRGVLKGPGSGIVGGVAAVEAAKQTRSPEGARFRDGVGDAATVEAAEQATCPERFATGIREAGVAAGADEMGADTLLRRSSL